MKKILGNTIELKGLSREDLDYISPAWHEFQYVPHSDRSKNMFYGNANRCNSEFDWDLLSGGLFLTIYKNANPIGLTIINFFPEYNKVDFRFSILLPEYRGSGIYSELNILRHKLAYSSETTDITTCRILQGSIAQENTIAALYTRQDYINNEPNNRTFIYSHITREEWEAWISHENQAFKFNSTFEVVDDI